MRKFKGFTLTELMIAMAVIGILVAVVTPAVMKTRPNKNKMMVKKTFYTAEQIVASLINDERLYPDMRDGCYDAAAASCAWGFDYTDEVTYEGVPYEGDNKFKGLFKNRLNVRSGDGDVVFTRDGVKWDLTNAKGWTRGQSPLTDTGKIIVDVNGAEGPNCREGTDCSADVFDQYQIEIFANGKMKISDSDTKASDYLTINTAIKDTVD